MLTRRRTLAILAAPFLLPLVLGDDARAQGGKPRVEVVVLYAHRDPKGGHIGPGVPDLPQLSQAPFNAYNTFTLEGQTTLTLDQPKSDDPWKGKPSAAFPLANGKPLRVALLEPLPGGRFHMGATIGKDSPDVVRWDAPAGQPVFIAGQSYKDGILVIGLTLE
jgi:hypothetical protein